MTRHYAHLDDEGRLVVDIGNVLDWDAGTADALIFRLAEHAAFSTEVVRQIIDHVVDGCSDRTWMSDGALEDIRMRLVPGQGKAVAELVAGLVHQRDRALEMEQRWRNAAWEIARYWDAMNEQRRRKVANPDYHVERTMTAEEALQWLERVKAEAEAAGSRVGGGS